MKRLYRYIAREITVPFFLSIFVFTFVLLLDSEVMSFGLSLGRVEALPPLLSAWGANIVFGLTGILMMMKVEGD